MATSLPRVVTFGEIMLRLAPPGHLRLVQAHSLDVTFAGAEANVAVALAQLGIESAFVTRLPDNDLAQACIHQLRGLGVDPSSILRGGRRMGILFLEHGAAQRAPAVVYDRAHSAIAEIAPEELDWNAIFDRATWFHFTGITPALSDACAQATLSAARAARAKGLTVSCDLNFRRSLWTTEQAGRVLGEMMPYVDFCIANEGAAADVFDIGANDCAGAARALSDRFGFRAVAMTMRESHSASRNGWSGLLHVGGAAYHSRHYEIEVIDRLGGGDAFAGGLIYAMIAGQTPQQIIEFATAAGCLKHSIMGDFAMIKLEEVKALAAGEVSGRVRR